MCPQFMCDICKKKFVRKDNMRDHILQIHAGKKPECEFCGKKMRSTALSRHRKFHCKFNKKQNTDIEHHESLDSDVKPKTDENRQPETPSKTWICSNDPFISNYDLEPFRMSDFIIFN